MGIYKALVLLNEHRDPPVFISKLTLLEDKQPIGTKISVQVLFQRNDLKS